MGDGARTGGWRPAGLCSFLVCDIAGFSSSARDDPVRLRVRRSMYEGLERSLRDGAGLELDDCYHEDRGDGVMVIVPPEVRTDRLLTGVVDRLRAEVRHHNGAANEAAQMRLRVAVNVGEAEADAHGVVGTELTHAFRLLDAEPLKKAVAAAETGIAVIVSRRVYEDVVRHGRGLVDPGDYYRADVAVKETEGEAWIMVPGTRPAPVPAGPPAVREDEPGPEEDGAGFVPPAEVPVPVLFQMVDDLLGIPQMRNERGRERLVGALSPMIAGVIPRSPEAKADLFAILQTCLDYPGGLQQFLQAVRGFVGESMAVRRLEQTTARLLLPPGD
ncbi:effector-associated domain 2-containing protein [Actinomadura verrucosospora]|uniref:effector-associated domain 2-containing protein n=1 Tax=Actinomadura verrucosospora TaxID=46165 RepID=UPI001563C1E9|nr:hypothetical protein [Actinomadura verrucosospora]